MEVCEEVCEESVMEESEYYLQLSQNVITFKGINKSQLTNIFFDEANTQVFSILSGDVTEVVVKSPIDYFCCSFKIKEKGRIVSIKFSYDQTILALQRTQTAVDFLTFENGAVSKEFTHSFKGCALLGYIWTGKAEILLVTNTYVKLCKIDVNACNLSNLKNLNISINWYIYYSPINLLLVNLGQTSNAMQLLQIKQGQFVKLMKFDIDCESNTKAKRPVSDRDISMGVVYNQPRILFMNLLTSSGAEVIVYTIIKLSSIKKTHVLRINQPGRFALNIVDNLIVVHNQMTKSSIVFDITDSDFQGAVKYINPVLDSKTLKPFSWTESVSSDEASVSPKIKPFSWTESVSSDEASVSPKNVDLYTQNWITFQPNIIMDVKAGYLWFLEINLMGFYNNIQNKKELVSFLLLRSNSKLIIGKTLEALLNDGFENLEDISEIFDMINVVYRSYLEENMKSQMGLPCSMTEPEEDPVVEFRTVVDQYFVYSYLLSKLAEQASQDKNGKEAKLLTWALLEYIRSLTDFLIPAQHFLYELLINCLVMQENYYQLHQLLQYRVVADSKPLACLLLSLENVYSGSSQLAIDMLERLGSAKEEITEILLSKNQVLSSLRYALSHPGTNDRVLCSKFMEIAKEQKDEQLHYSIATLFKDKIS